ELRDLLHEVAASVRRAVPCDLLAGFLCDSGPGTLRTFVVDFPEARGFFREEPKDPLRRIPIPMEGTFAGKVLRTDIAWIGNSTELARLGLDSDPGIAEGLKTGCVLPIVCCNNVLGVMAVARREEKAFTEDEADLLRQVASQVAIAVDNALTVEER